MKLRKNIAATSILLTSLFFNDVIKFFLLHLRVSSISTPARRFVLFLSFVNWTPTNQNRCWFWFPLLCLLFLPSYNFFFTFRLITRNWYEIKCYYCYYYFIILRRWWWWWWFIWWIYMIVRRYMKQMSKKRDKRVLGLQRFHAMLVLIELNV